MNCQDVSLILDSRDVLRLSASERLVVETHLHGCAECADDWQSHQRVIGSQVPEMASDLPERVWQFVEAAALTTAAPRRFRRSLILGSLLFIGAAAAMIGWQLLDESRLMSTSMAVPAGIESNVGSGTRMTQPVTPTTQPADPASADAIEPSLRRGTANQTPVTPPGRARPIRHRLVVLPPRLETSDPAAVAYFNPLSNAIVGELRSMADLEILEVSAQQLEAIRSDLPPSPPAPTANEPTADEIERYVAIERERQLAIARHFGGEYTLQVSLNAPSPAVWEIRAGYLGVAVGGVVSSAGLTRSRAEDSRPLAASLARRVYAALLPESGVSQYLSVLANPLEAESSRLQALEALVRPSKASSVETSAGSSNAVVQGAVELARSSTPKTRGSIWQLLGRTGTPAAREALRHALLSEPEVGARREAAISLFNQASDPAVRAAFEDRATTDPSVDIRSLAELALIPEGQRVSHIVARLLDRNLTYEARMAPLMIARSARLEFANDLTLDAATLAAVTEIAANSSDPAVRSAARSELRPGFRPRVR